MTRLPICHSCKHLNQDRRSCKAFPESIPGLIYAGINYHLHPWKDQVGDYILEFNDSTYAGNEIYDLLLDKKTIHKLEGEVHTEARKLFKRINELHPDEFICIEIYLSAYENPMVKEERLVLGIKNDETDELISIGFGSDLAFKLGKLLMNARAVGNTTDLKYIFPASDGEGDFNYSSFTRKESTCNMARYMRARYRLNNRTREKQGYTRIHGEELRGFIDKANSSAKSSIPLHIGRVIASIHKERRVAKLEEIEEITGQKLYAR